MGRITAHRPYSAAAASSVRIDTVDLNPAFCPSEPVCEPVVGGRVVWRDDHHYTASYASSRRAQVWRILTQSGALDIHA